MMSNFTISQTQTFLGGHLNSVVADIEKTIFHDSLIAYSLLILGESGVGKTTIGRYIVNELNKNAEPKDGTPTYPGIFVKVSHLQSTSQFLKQILRAIGVTKFHRSEDEDTLINRIKNAVIEHGIKTIVVDEMQNALPSNYGQRLMEMSKTLAGLIDDTNIPLIILGTPALSRLLQINKGAKDFKTEEQLARRFKAPIRILDFPHNAIAWLEAINFYLDLYNCPHLTTDDRSLIYRIHIATRGRLGLLTKLFSLSKLNSPITTKESINELKRAYSEGFSNAFNPFDMDKYSNKDIEKSLYKGDC